jgi:hypothetical protein
MVAFISHTRISAGSVAVTLLAARGGEPHGVTRGQVTGPFETHGSPRHEQRFFISTTRDRVKYKIFRRDPRVELIVDDSTGHRYLRVSGTVEVLEDLPSNPPMNRAIREKHGIPVAAEEELAASLVADNRVLLAVTPANPASEWSVLGVEA